MATRIVPQACGESPELVRPWAEFPPFTPWAEFYAALLLAYSQLYKAAGAYRDLHCAKRVPGTTGKEALHRIDELVLLVQRTGVTKPGEEEQMSYILQNKLTAKELPHWTALENGDMSVSDASLNELEGRRPRGVGNGHQLLRRPGRGGLAE